MAQQVGSSSGTAPAAREPGVTPGGASGMSEASRSESTPAGATVTVAQDATVPARGDTATAGAATADTVAGDTATGPAVAGQIVTLGGEDRPADVAQPRRVRRWLRRSSPAPSMDTASKAPSVVAAG